MRPVSAQRRKYSPQFKAEAVAMVIETGRPVAEVARSLELGEGTLGNWVNAYRPANPEPDAPLSPVQRARVKEMEDEIRRLRMENEFLKKARGLRRPDASVTECCALIEAEKANYTVIWMCGLLGVPRSSSYAWRGRTEPPTQVRRRRALRAGAAGVRRLAAACDHLSWPR